MNDNKRRSILTKLLPEITSLQGTDMFRVNPNGADSDQMVTAAQIADYANTGGGGLLAANNLSDVADAATALNNLGGLAIDGSNSPTADINFNSHNINGLLGSDYITNSHNAINYIDAFKHSVFFSDAVTIDGLTLATSDICASPGKAFNNYICVGVYLQPVNITGVGILNPVFNLGNDTGSFNDILNAFTPVFISFGNEQVLKPAPRLVSGTSWIGKDIKCRVTTAATGYTAFDFSIRVALMCIT